MDFLNFQSSSEPYMKLQGIFKMTNFSFPRQKDVDVFLYRGEQKTLLRPRPRMWDHLFLLSTHYVQDYSGSLLNC